MTATEREKAPVFAADVHYDANGLVPAVLVDEADGAVLMVAWMNAESLAITLEKRLATFWSRSRQEIWTKGLTSGNVMHVVDIKVDCDADTLLVTVRPEGPACHTGARSCFYRQLEDFVPEGADDTAGEKVAAAGENAAEAEAAE